MDLVFAGAVVPEVFEAAVAVADDVDAVELVEAVLAAVLAAAVVAVVVVAAVVLTAEVVVPVVVVVAVGVVVPVVVPAVVVGAAAVTLVVEVRVTLPVTEPVVAAVVVAAVVVLATVVLAVVVFEVVAAVVAAPVVLEVPLDEPSLEPPQPTSANDMVNAQGRISRFAARLTEASAYDDSSCTCAACACSVRKLSFDNFAISPISTIPRGRLFGEVQTTEIKSREHVCVIRDKASTIFIYAVTLCVRIL